MRRREFMFRVGSLVVWVPATRLLVGCGEDDSGGPASLSFVSSTDNLHSHQLTLQLSVIESPPAAGVQPATTNVSAHVHTVVLTEADLLAIRDNATVMKTTSVESAHSHVFNFKRSPGTTPGGGTYEPPGDGY